MSNSEYFYNFSASVTIGCIIVWSDDWGCPVLKVRTKTLPRSFFSRTDVANGAPVPKRVCVGMSRGGGWNWGRDPSILFRKDALAFSIQGLGLSNTVELPTNAKGFAQSSFAFCVCTSSSSVCPASELTEWHRRASFCRFHAHLGGSWNGPAPEWTSPAKNSVVTMTSTVFGRQQKFRRANTKNGNKCRTKCESKTKSQNKKKGEMPLMGAADRSAGEKKRRHLVITWFGSPTLSPPSSKRTFSKPFKEKCMSEVVRIDSIIIFHLSELRKARFFILCDVIFLVRLGGNLGSIFWGVKGLKSVCNAPNFTLGPVSKQGRLSYKPRDTIHVREGRLYVINM